MNYKQTTTQHGVSKLFKGCDNRRQSNGPQSEQHKIHQRKALDNIEKTVKWALVRPAADQPHSSECVCPVSCLLQRPIKVGYSLPTLMP